MGRLLRVLADRLQTGTPVADRVLSWPGDIGSSGQSVPLRLAGALHRLVLAGLDAPLTAAYPPNMVDDDRLWAAVSNALDSHAPRLLDWLASPPQTNELRRASVLIAAGHRLTAAHQLPIMLSELGASAGLNLNWDRFALDIAGHRLGPPDARVRLSPNWTGQLPERSRPEVVDKRGVDLRPVDLENEHDRLRLLSYLWPDQPDRMALTENAISLPRPPVDRADAIDWLETRLTQQPEGTLHLVYHTIAWQYFPKEAQQRGTALLAEAGQKATETRPLAHLSMEADGDGPGAGLTLTTWPGGAQLPLGRADFHGRWVDWHAPPRFG